MITLNDGNQLPPLAFGAGTKQMLSAAEAGKVTKQALDAGFRALDCSVIYETNRFVGKAVQEFLMDHNRDEIHISMKCGDLLKQPAEYDIRGWLKRALQEMGVNYFDLFMIQCPEMVSDKVKAWTEMEQIKKDGLSKSIGVSTFGAADLQTILDSCEIPPAVNQLEYTPQAVPVYHQLLPLMQKHKIALSGFGALGAVRNKTSDDVAGAANKIAERKGWTVERVLIQWSAQEGGAVVTTSSKPERMAQIIKDFGTSKLSDDDVKELNDAGAKKPFLHLVKMHGEGGFTFAEKNYLDAPDWLVPWREQVRSTPAE